MISQKIVIPAQAGIQGIGKVLKGVDSCFHGNDGKKTFRTFYETIIHTYRKGSSDVKEKDTNRQGQIG
jgi:hypothetical protein